MEWKGLNACADMIWVVWTTMLGSQEKNDICNQSTSFEMEHAEPMATVAVWS